MSRVTMAAVRALLISATLCLLACDSAPAATPVAATTSAPAPQPPPAAPEPTAPEPATPEPAPSTAASAAPAQSSSSAPSRVVFKGPPISDKTAALATFDRAWKEAIGPALAKHRPKAHATWARAIPGSLASAKLEPCSALAALVRDTLGPTEMDSILLGQVSDLDAPGSCWTVHRSSGFMTLIVAFRQTDATPLLVYWPPEG